MSSRRFPPPWFVEELDACYVVRDHDEQALSYIFLPSVVGIIIVDLPTGFNHEQEHSNASRGYHRERN